MCGQAEAVLDALGRIGDLPPPLCIEIEEAVEIAWEIAYRVPGSRRPAREGKIVRLFR